MQFHLKNSGNCLGGQVGCLLQWDLHSRGRKLCWVSTWEKPSAASQKTTEFHADTNLLGGPFGSILDSPSETELTLCQQNTSSGSWLISTLVSYLQSEAKKTPGQWLFIGVYTSTVRNQAANWCKYFADAEGEHFIPEDAKQLVELPEEFLVYNWDASSLPDEASRFVLLAWRRPTQPPGTGTSSHQRQTAFGFWLGGVPGG